MSDTAAPAGGWRVSLERDEDGWVVACCPDLPGCVSQGRSEAEARANLAEAIQGYVECHANCGEALPVCPAPVEDGGEEPS